MNIETILIALDMIVITSYSIHYTKLYEKISMPQNMLHGDFIIVLLIRLNIFFICLIF